MSAKLEPSKLHPGGFAHVPMALLMHPEAKPGHVAAYAAIASEVRNHDEWTEIRNRRLQERAGMGSWHSLSRYVSELEAWGLVKRRDRSGFPTGYVLMPTPDVRPKVEAERQADANADPLVAAHRGGRPPSENDAPVNPLADSTEGVKGPDTGNPLADFGGGPSRISGGDPRANPRDSLDVLDVLDEKNRCAPTHLELSNPEKIQRLAKAVGKQAADDALTEVDARLQDPTLAGEVQEPWGLARELAECYRGHCRNPEHGDLHGQALRDYHRGRRADSDLERRASEARSRAPGGADAEMAEVAKLDAERQRQQREALAVIKAQADAVAL